MSREGEDLRERLIEQIRRLPDARLGRIAQVLEDLACELPIMAFSDTRGDVLPRTRDWPHAPVHRICEHGTYLVTAGTLHKQHHFRGPARLDLQEGKLLELAAQHGWQLEA